MTAFRIAALDRTITITPASGFTTDAHGVSVPGSATPKTVRAQVLDNGIASEAHDGSTVATGTLSFRLRYLASIAPGDHLTYAGAPYVVTAVKEVGRRRFLEITVQAA